MTFNPEKHHRRSIRLQEYDYTQPGAYFVTICTYQRQCLFGEIIDAAMHLNTCGEIVQACWNNLPNHFPFMELDAFVIMPNHIHGIIILTEQMVDAGVGVGVEVGAKHSCPGVSNSPKTLSKNASPCPDVSNSPKTSPCPDVPNSSPYLDVSSPLPPKGTQSGSLGAMCKISNQFRPEKSIESIVPLGKLSGSATTTIALSMMKNRYIISDSRSLKIRTPGHKTQRTRKN